MLEILKQNRMRKLEARYYQLKAQAKKVMQSGDLANYINTIAEADKVKKMYLSTAVAKY